MIQAKASGRVLALLPQHITSPTSAVEMTAKDEKQVGKPVDVAASIFGECFGMVQGDHRAFGTAASGAAQMREGCRAGAAGEDEFLEHG